MNVTLKELSLEITDAPTAIAELTERVNEMNKASKELYSYMIIDGVHIYEPYESYLLEHFAGIDQVEIVTQTYRQQKWSMLQTLKEYLERALPDLERLSDGFYQGADSETWTRLNEMLEAMGWLLQVVELMGQESEPLSNPEAYTEALSQIQEKISQLMEAVQAGDTTMIGDVIQYEILPVFQSLGIVVDNTLENEVA
ncbi:hypothetical protein [Paenibacillus sp. LjRoot56]|uniref:hypothetical protein n=1 Tax=Paenibacillus sp. LjRoot56 TaxID=3342333 RepID=UPI003ECE5744